MTPRIARILGASLFVIGIAMSQIPGTVTLIGTLLGSAGLFLVFTAKRWARTPAAETKRRSRGT